MLPMNNALALRAQGMPMGGAQPIAAQPGGIQTPVARPVMGIRPLQPQVATPGAVATPVAPGAVAQSPMNNFLAKRLGMML